MKARLTIGAIGVLVAVTAILVLSQLGVPVDFAIAWVLIAAGLGLVSRQVYFDDGFEWPPGERTRAVRGSEVSRLAWSVNTRTGEAGHVLVRRVEGVLRRRLRQRGFDLDAPEQHPQIDALLGSGIRETLTRRDVQRTDIERVLDAIERLPTRTDPTRTEET